MENHFEGGIDAEKAFLEYHFYKGGLRTEAFSLSGARPSWAPPTDWVGFRDEFALDPDDRVVEIVKIEGDCGPIAWISVYEAAPDQVYGDRKNHAGMGVWLLGSYPNEPSLLVHALRSLLDLARKDYGQRLPAQTKTFLSEYLENYVAEYEALPRPFGGLTYATNQVASTLTRHLDVTHEKFEENLDELVYRLFYLLSDDASENARALILLTPKVKLRETAATDIQRGRLASDLLKQLPIAMRAQSQLIASLRQELNEERKAVEELDGKVDQLNSEVMSARRRANDAESQLKDLQASLEENDERKRFSLLQSGIADVGNNVAQIQVKLNALRQEIVSDLRREMRFTPPAAPSNSQFRAQHATPETAHPSKIVTSKPGSNIIFYVALFSFVLISTLIAGLIWYF